MPNQLALFDLTVYNRIDAKVDMYSIAKQDVGNSFRELADLALLFPPLSPLKTYPRYWIGAATDGSPALYRALANDVSGDTSIGANWELISGGGGGTKQIFDMGTSTNVANNYTFTNASVTAYNTEHLYYITPNVTNAGAANMKFNALVNRPIMKASGGSYVNVDAGDLSANITIAVIYKGTFWLVVAGLPSGGSKEITDSGLISLLIADGSWADQLNSSWIGGTISGSEDSYYVYAAPGRPDGILPTYEYRLLKFNGTLTPIRKVLSGW